ncbi:hypothetical protein [Merismopedia glauca]|uniref:Uncharacterized protein n=1 Tax=Merismopedia glauca CCAP 1448/3 TaxID=1296344 RepID=A0A2T1C8N1_9CYAN|nr:hypothetical protein [Merismopedia glauca]PSB04635.1 hypothetical protein C7B64_02820 [Merismopedia glauca CCAP 1448/3]
MKNKTKICLTLAVFSVSTAFSLPANAQTNQTLGKCISEVRKSSNYAISSDKAAESCVNTLRYQSPVENLGECISGVRESSNYAISSDNASQLCQSLLAQQLQQQGGGNNNNGSTIIVIPNGQQPTPQPQRRTQKQCVNKMFNQVWDDIHCQFNNGMFEWRTVYLD